MIEAESAFPEGVGDVGYAVVAQNVEGEASGASHDGWVVANAAFVLVAGDVTDVVVAVFDAPVAADGPGPCAGRQVGGGGDVVGDLAALIPHASGGAAQPGVTRDADDGLDEGPPLARVQGFADGEDFDGAPLMSGSALVARRGGVGGRAPGSDGDDDVKQIGLVLLELDQQMAPRGQGRSEGFFGRAWRRA